MRRATSNMPFDFGDVRQLRDITTERVYVQSQAIRMSISVARHVVIVRSAVQKIVTDVARSGIRIAMQYDGTEIAFSPLEERIVSTHWQQFTEDLLWSLIVVGIVAVGREPRTGLPFVVPYNKARFMFTYTARTPRVYSVEDTDSQSQRRMPNVNIFVWHPPDENGWLTSPAALVVSHARAILAMNANQQVADDVRTHPTWTFVPNPQAPGQPAPDQPDLYAPNEVELMWRDFAQRLQRHHNSLITQTQNAAQDTASALVQQSMANGVVRSEVADKSTAPYLNSIILPAGVGLGNPPLPQSNPLYSSELQYHVEQILEAFSIPPLVMGASHGVRYSAEPERAYRQWADLVIMYQHRLNAIVSEVYMAANKRRIQQYCLAFVRQVAPLRTEAARFLELIDAMENAEEQQEKQPRKRQRNNDAEEEQEAGAAGEKNAPGGQTSAARLALESAARGGAAPPGEPELHQADDGSYMFDDTPELLAKARIVLGTKDDEIAEFIRGKFTVNVQFLSRPSARPEQVASLAREGLISQTDYALLAAGYLGIPESNLLLTEEERVAEQESRAAVKEAGMTEMEREEMRLKLAAKQTQPEPKTEKGKHKK